MFTHTIPLRYGHGMGIAWKAYHKGGPIIGSPWNHPWCFGRCIAPSWSWLLRTSQHGGRRCSDWQGSILKRDTWLHHRCAIPIPTEDGTFLPPKQSTYRDPENYLKGTNLKQKVHDFGFSMLVTHRAQIPSVCQVGFWFPKGLKWRWVHFPPTYDLETST